MSETINPIEFFKEEMDNDDIAVRVNAMHRLKTITVLIGGEQFKNHLLPYLESNNLYALYRKIFTLYLYLYLYLYLSLYLTLYLTLYLCLCLTLMCLFVNRFNQERR